MASETPKRARKPRLNHAKRWNELEFYIATVIRIKEPEAEGLSTAMIDNLKGQLKAYRDVLDMMQNGGGK